MSGNLPKRLLQLSEADDHPVLSGIEAVAYPKAELDRLLSCRVLVERPPATEWPVCETCECDLDARPIQYINGRIVAPCPLDAGCDAELFEDNLRAFELNVSMLIEALAADNDIAERPNRLLPGLWYLGSVRFAGGGRRALFFACTLTHDFFDVVPEAIKTAAGIDPVTLIVPKSPPFIIRRRLEEAGFGVVVAEEALIGRAPGEPFRLDLDRLVSSGSAEPRLRVEPAGKRIRLDGVDIPLPPRSFALVLILAETSGRLVSRQSIERQLWHTPVSKKAVADAVNRLKAVMVKKGISRSVVDALIENQRPDGYRLDLPSHEVLIVA